MTQREQLRDNYEDALFALLMDEFAEREGERLLKENERLKLDPDIVVSDELDKRCIKTIDRTLAKGRRRKVKYAAYRVISRVAVAVLAVAVLFGTAYAAFPEVRIKTLNLIIELSEKAASLTLDGTNSNMQGDDEIPSALNKNGTLRGYLLPSLPEGFVANYETSTHRSAEISYENGQGARVDFSIIDSNGTVANRDTEDAQKIENVSIHGYSGLLIEKGDSISLTWADTDQNNFITIYSIGIGKKTTLSYAEAIKFVGIT